MTVETGAPKAGPGNRHGSTGLRARREMIGRAELLRTWARQVQRASITSMGRTYCDLLRPLIKMWDLLGSP